MGESLVRRRRLNVFEIELVLRDLHDNNLSKRDVWKKYTIGQVQLDRILREYKYGFWLEMPKYPVPVTKSEVTNKGEIPLESQFPHVPLGIDPDPILVDKPITKKELEDEIELTALKVVALTLQRMQYSLEIPKSGITPGQLSQIMSAAAPYAVGRRKTREDSKEKSKSKDLLTIFKKSANAKVNTANRN
jgi:hypothetical protein